MTIKAKLLLIAEIIALSLLLSVFSMTTLNNLAATQSINNQLLSDMLMLRRNEKDYALMQNHGCDIIQ